jgi:hypothetical protein
LIRFSDGKIAVLTDTAAKRDAHERDFRTALHGGTTFHVWDLIRMSEYPPLSRFAAFYGQSLALVDFLTRQGKPGDFVRFVECSLEKGHDEALDHVDGISSTQELDDLWQQRVVNVALAGQ